MNDFTSVTTDTDSLAGFFRESLSHKIVRIPVKFLSESEIKDLDELMQGVAVKQDTTTV